LAPSGVMLQGMQHIFLLTSSKVEVAV
jgi:hypothetical protein